VSDKCQCKSQSLGSLMTKLRCRGLVEGFLEVFGIRTRMTSKQAFDLRASDVDSGARPVASRGVARQGICHVLPGNLVVR